MSLERLSLYDSTFEHDRDPGDTILVRGTWQLDGQADRLILFRDDGRIYKRCTFRLTRISKLRDGPCVRHYELLIGRLGRRRLHAHVP